MTRASYFPEMFSNMCSEELQLLDTLLHFLTENLEESCRKLVNLVNIICQIICNKPSSNRGPGDISQNLFSRK